MGKIKDWEKGSGLIWYYHGKSNRHGIDKLYIDNIVPEKGWRVVVVAKYNTMEWYFPTKKEAINYAMDYMLDR